ncbi:MAG: lysylphosphatidylglycerol synthase transmembrane domain-containing protein [Candidatus Sedimenticola endophacoides]
MKQPFLEAIKKLVKPTLAVIFLSFFAQYVYIHLSDISNIRLSNPVLLIPLTGLFIAQITLTGLLNGAAIRTLGKAIPHRDEFFLAAVTRLVNYVLPFRGGMAYRARYIISVAKLSLKEFIIISIALTLLSLCASSWLGLTALILSNKASATSIALFVSLSASTSLLLLFPAGISRSAYLASKIPSLSRSMEKITRHRPLFRSIIILTLGNILLTSLTYYLGFITLSDQIPFTAAMLLACAGILSLLVQLTPAGLGVVELFVAAAATIIGANDVIAVSVTLLGRVLAVSSCTVISLFGIPYLERRIKTTQDAPRQ